MKPKYVIGPLVAGVLLACTAASAQPAPTLKEYALRTRIATCPTGTLERSAKGPVLYCLLGPTTLANQRVNSVMLSIFEGRLSSVTFYFDNRAHGEIRKALIQKFGKPTGGKAAPRIDLWTEGSDLLVLDGGGRQSMVMLADDEATQRAHRYFAPIAFTSAIPAVSRRTSGLPQ
jgi:hypothetical protein